ncbi:chromosome partitioning protein [Dactylosporangium cerinum]|uniref:Chromosome partitioning protein n=1 Tax=Dactylosporangium cerinum TaxID=1434730 RepID=A0ABV9W1L4_9ACTN
MVIEAGVVAGYVIAWAVRKARRATGRLDAEADAVIDAGLDKLHEVVATKLGAHPALEDLAEEAAVEDGQVSELTRQQVELAVTAGARKDDAFGQAVTDLVAQLRAAEQTSGTSVVAGAGSAVFTGNSYTQATGHGVAFGQIAGGVTVAREAGQSPDPS